MADAGDDDNDSVHTHYEEIYDPNYDPTDEEVRDYALYLGFDLPHDDGLLWIAREGLKETLPEEWKSYPSPAAAANKGGKDEDENEEEGEPGASVYYFNSQTGESSWLHPCDVKYMGIFKAEKERRRTTTTTTTTTTIAEEEEEEEEAAASPLKPPPPSQSMPVEKRALVGSSQDSPEKKPPPPPPPPPPPAPASPKQPHQQQTSMWPPIVHRVDQEEEEEKDAAAASSSINPYRTAAAAPLDDNAPPPSSIGHAFTKDRLRRVEAENKLLVEEGQEMREYAMRKADEAQTAHAKWLMAESRARTAEDELARVRNELRVSKAEFERRRLGLTEELDSTIQRLLVAEADRDAAERKAREFLVQESARAKHMEREIEAMQKKMLMASTGKQVVRHAPPPLPAAGGGRAKHASSSSPRSPASTTNGSGKGLLLGRQASLASVSSAAAAMEGLRSQFE